MNKTLIREDRNANKLDSKNKFTHTSNQNYASPSFEEEEQKLSHVEGRPVERCILAQAHKWGGGWTWRHQYPTQTPQYGVEWSGMQWWNSLENKMQKDKDKEMNWKWTHKKRTLNINNKDMETRSRGMNQCHIANPRECRPCPRGPKKWWRKTRGAFHEHLSKAPRRPAWIGSWHRWSCWANHLSWDCNPCLRSPRCRHLKQTHYARAPW